MKPIVRVAFALAAVCLAACNRSSRHKYVPQEVQSVVGVEAHTVTEALHVRADSMTPPQWVTPERWARVRKLYAAYEYAPLWLEEGGIKDRASALLAALDSAPAHGLRTDAYPLDSIRKFVNAKRIDSGATPKQIAEADAALTAAYVAYASDMLAGQIDPRTVSQSWHISLGRKVIDSALTATLEDSSMADGLAAMAPADSEYQLLKREYGRYRAIAAQGGWKKVEPGVSPEELTERLVAEGYAADSSDAGVINTLKSWQERHGLQPDGKIGSGTRAALNVPAEERLGQIASNLERHRWLPRALGNRYIYVNVPAFRLDAYDSGQRVLSMKVIVGAEYNGHATPVFSDSLRTVVFRPYWKPTPNILKNEILPKIATDKSYLARNDMEWASEGGARVLRQKPGPHNSLGLVKFLFPNDFNIYLHDTNQRSLFAKNTGAASHGCIRLQEPAKLAEYVLRWPADSVQKAMEQGHNNVPITVAEKVPVYIVYFTAFGRDGALNFADDVYRRDEALKIKLNAPALTAARAPSAADRDRIGVTRSR